MADSDVLKSKQLVSFDTLTKILDAVVMPIFKQQAQDIKELKVEKAALKVLVDELQNSYKGVWVRGHAYGKGNEVTYDGSLYKAMTATCHEPGTPGCGWILSIKKGRDGRDARR